MAVQPPFVQGALVSGASAHVLDRVLRSPNVVRVLRGLPEWMRAEVGATAAAIRRAAVEYESRPISFERSGEAAPGEIAPELGGSDWLGTPAAAELLNVTARRAQQLGAAGLGCKVDGRWRFDETAVREYRRRAAG